MASSALQGKFIAHTTDYYWPIGDAPLYSGDGTQALTFAPFYALWGWPAGVPLFVAWMLTLNGIAAAWLARGLGASRLAAWAIIPAAVFAPYVLVELSGARFSQAATWPLWLFLGAWFRYLVEPSRARAVIAGLLLTLTSFSYWYYGWFGVLAGAIAALWVHRTAVFHTARLRNHALFSLVFVVTVTPWAWAFIHHWDLVPGAEEATRVFPHPSSATDRIPTWPQWKPGDPSETSAAVSIPLALAALFGLAHRLRGASRTSAARASIAACVIGGMFYVLGWGPAGEYAPFTVLYGAHAALRRFWWPIRHIAVVDGLLFGIAAVGLTEALRRLPAKTRTIGAIAFAAAIPFSLWTQGLPLMVEGTPIAYPQTEYTRLADEPPGVVLVLPLSPALTGSNEALIHQISFQKSMITGHSPWVARARPPEWDQWVQSHGWLSRLATVEQEGWRGGEYNVDTDDLRNLYEEGVRYIVVDRSLLPLAFRDLVSFYKVMLENTLGRPRIRTQQVSIWVLPPEVHTTSVEAPPWTWPSGVYPAGPDFPLAGRRPEGALLGPPSGSAPRP